MTGVTQPSPHESTSAVTEAVGNAILSTLDGGDNEPDRDQHLRIVRRTSEAGDVVHNLLRQAVAAARSGGHSWAAIGAELGMSRQAVQQRFGDKRPPYEADSEQRWLGPVTAFDEMHELTLAGQCGWRLVEVGLLRHRMVRTDTQWEHKRVVWGGAVQRHEDDGWEVAVRAFPLAYLVRPTGLPASVAS